MKRHDHKRGPHPLAGGGLPAHFERTGGAFFEKKVVHWIIFRTARYCSLCGPLSVIVKKSPDGNRWQKPLNPCVSNA